MASPQLQRLKQMLGVRPRVGFDLEAFREDFERFARYFPPPPSVEVHDAALGGVPARRLVPAGADPESCVLYLHGGGYISGSLDTHLEVMARLARASRSIVVGIDYRRAPEDPFPAALEDAVAAFRELTVASGGIRHRGLVGDSAGGGLALAMMAALRDAGETLPEAAVLFSPWVDLTLAGGSIQERLHLDRVLHPSILKRAVELYLAGADPRNPSASPLFGDLRGLPPTLVQVGTSEILFDDSRRLAAALESAGSPVELRIWDEMLHFWQFYATLLPEGDAAIEEAGVFLSERLGSK